MQLILVDDLPRGKKRKQKQEHQQNKIVAYQKNFKKNWVYGLACHF